MVLRLKFNPDRQVCRKLDKALFDLESLAERGKITGFLNNIRDADVLTSLADDIRDAMIDYQVRPHGT